MGSRNKSNKQRLAVTMKKSAGAAVLRNRAIRLEFVGSQGDILRICLQVG